MHLNLLQEKVCASELCSAKMSFLYLQIARFLLDKADSLGSMPDEASFVTVDEKTNNNDGKAHRRKPSNGVQKQNKIINPVKQIERMATSGSFTLKESSPGTPARKRC